MHAIPYAKMNGIGNSILVVDLRGSDLALSGDQARALGRDPRLHFDQLMAIGDRRSPDAEAFVDIFNIDGTRAGACGNGMRCVAWFVERGEGRDALRLETAAGILLARRLDTATYAVDMGPPRFDWRDIPLGEPVPDTADVRLPHPPAEALSRFSAVDMGNPHAVFFVPDADAIDLPAVGPVIEHDAIFPDRANVSFATIVARDVIRLRVWERGAGATLACGSAACATLVAAVRAGRTAREAQVSQLGGDLVIAWRPEDGHVIMTGGVALEHEGLLPPDLWGRAA